MKWLPSQALHTPQSQSVHPAEHAQASIQTGAFPDEAGTALQTVASDVARIAAIRLAVCVAAAAALARSELALACIAALPAVLRDEAVDVPGALAFAYGSEACPGITNRTWAAVPAIAAPNTFRTVIGVKLIVAQAADVVGEAALPGAEMVLKDWSGATNFTRVPFCYGIVPVAVFDFATFIKNLYCTGHHKFEENRLVCNLTRFVILFEDPYEHIKDLKKQKLKSKQKTS